MPIKLPNNYSQLENKWKNELLGLNEDKIFNLENFGCLISCLASVCVYYGKSEDPLTLNQKLKEQSGFINGGIYVWGSLSKLYSDLEEKRTVTPLELTNDQITEIKMAIDSGYPVIVQLDYNPKTVKNDMHFVVITNYNPKDENDFTIMDPLGGRTVSLREYLAFFKPSARKTIEQYIIIKGPVPKIEEKPMETVIEPQIPKNVQPVVEPVVQNPETPIVQPQTLPNDMVVISKVENEKNVKMATQYKDVVSYLEISKAPEDTMFEDVRRVIAGIKSLKTDYENKKKTAEADLAKAHVDIDDLRQQVSSLESELLRREKLHKVEIDTLKQNQPTTDKLKTEYEAAYKDVAGKLKEALSAVTELKKMIAEKRVEMTHDQEIVSATITYNKNVVHYIYNTFTGILKFFTQVEWPK